MCPVCDHPDATCATVFYPRDPESGQTDCGVILVCPSCGTLIDEEIQQAIDSLPVAPMRDEEEKVLCPI